MKAIKTTTKFIKHRALFIAIAGLFYIAVGCGKPNDSLENAIDNSYVHNLPTGAQIAARCRDMALKGRALYVAIVKGNTEREAQGYESMWPKTTKNISWDKNDIAGMAFVNSKQYFNALFSLSKSGKPYVNGGKDFAFNLDGQVLWSVMLDHDETNISDEAPLLISANFDCSKLPSRWPDVGVDADKVIPIGTCPIIGNTAVIIIQKGSGLVLLPADKVTLRNIYGEGRYALPQGYLTPSGIVKVRQ